MFHSKGKREEKKINNVFLRKDRRKKKKTKTKTKIKKLNEKENDSREETCKGQKARTINWFDRLTDNDTKGFYNADNASVRIAPL